MDTFILALKRILRRGIFPAFCLLLILASIGASFLGEADRLTPAGVCDLDGSVLSEAVTARLERCGFLPYESEAELRADLVSRRIDIGVLLPEGFSEKLLSEDPEGCAEFVEGAGAFVPQLYLNQATAAVFAEKTPYCTVRALRSAGAEISEEETFAVYRAMMDDGALFSFELRWGGENGSEEEAAVPDKARSYVLGTLSLLLFVGVTLTVTGLLAPRETEPARRIGGEETFLRLTLPAACLETAGILLALLLSCLLSAAAGHGTLTSLLFPAAVYTLLLTGFACAVQGVLPRPEWIYGLIFVVSLFSLLLLPIWMDTALLFPVLGILRVFLPPYWLWLAASHPWAAFAVSVPLLAAGGCVLYRELNRRALMR